MSDLTSKQLEHLIYEIPRGGTVAVDDEVTACKMALRTLEMEAALLELVGLLDEISNCTFPDCSLWWKQLYKVRDKARKLVKP